MSHLFVHASSCACKKKRRVAVVEVVESVTYSFRGAYNKSELTHLPVKCELDLFHEIYPQIHQNSLQY